MFDRAVLGRSSNARIVDVVTLDEAAALLGDKRVAAVKMDIEGAELEVLRGAGDFLRRHQPSLVVEPHPDGSGKMNTEQICEILHSFNYSADLVSQGAEDWPLIAARPKQAA
ncbi:MAG: FkbM family methyltransferase [Bryobacteraceae bacterium]